MGRNKKFCTKEECNRIFDLYNRGYSRMNIAKYVGCAASTVSKILEREFGIGKGVITLVTGPFSVVEDQRIILMAREGKTCARISQSLHRTYNAVYARMRVLGLSTGKINSTLVESYRTNTPTEVSRFSDAIYPEDIANMRASVKIGDVMKIRSCKGLTEEMNNGGFGGAIRDARVVNVDHPRFCLVEIIGSGIMESKLWVDMVMEQRRREKAETIMEV